MYKFLSILLFTFLFSCTATKVPTEEFRGVWVATVVNIDWPKKATDNPEKQKKDFTDILDFYQTLNFNAAIVQVRTAGDAFYPTKLAPWSKYLTGQEGEAPKEFSDPLEWMIKETHQRGMEFHAWLNPYRATFDLDTLALSQKHDFYQHHDWMVKYGKKYYYNPGLPEVRNQFVKIIEELVGKYEIDAIHFDDYFYPYKIKDEVFDDSTAYQTYGLQDQSLEDWRRSNVDSLVKNVHQTIKRTKPWVQFGISPFGVWKNNSTDPRGSNTKAGQTTYEDLYADPLLWIEKGWLDYLAPQAYWSMDYPPASHREIVSWWAKTSSNTNLYIGNGTYKIKNNKDEAWEKKNEIPKQLNFARDQENVAGNIFFSAKSLIGKHPEITKSLKRKFYPLPSKNPSSRNKIKRHVLAPSVEKITKNGNDLEICISHSDSIPRFINYYTLKGKEANKKVLIAKDYLSESQNQGCFENKFTKKNLRKGIGVTVIDPFGNESSLLELNLKLE
ncbi:glycoside hydrolase family 10 protein [Flagellimonas nanhaiensis]|uniref:Glycosyl hydrolase n=1 Tax=Flagellimonas nanhaiensis TaxID=2292706 RepID=A0A371JTH6_9FLAO|nr:family 10 glycosylhydrolase [Allomuricauda nanhaiensis]RDY61097.1 glycosyl hydrolase [Allomuricauda nanhaiensis]